MYHVGAIRRMIKLTRVISSPWTCWRRGLLGLTKLRALSSLNLSDNTAVRDIGLENLTRLCSLKHLDLSYTGAPLSLHCDMVGFVMQRHPARARCAAVAALSMRGLSRKDTQHEPVE